MGDYINAPKEILLSLSSKCHFEDENLWAQFFLQDTLDEYLTIQKEAELLTAAQIDDANTSSKWVD